MDDSFPIGFVTIAAGSAIYAEMAVDMALSLRRFHTEPIVVLAEGAALTAIRQRGYERIFDRIIEIPPGNKAGRRAKFLLAELAPLEQAVFVDADVLVLDRLDREMAQCASAPISMMGRFLEHDSRERHHNVPVAELCRLFQSKRFFTCHSGSFVYQRDSARAFLAEGLRIYDELLSIRRRPGWFMGDELAFGLAAAKLGIRQMSHPYPVVWSSEFAHFDFTSPSKPLLHFHSVPPADLRTAAMRMVVDLRRAAGKDPKPGLRAWGVKTRRNSLDPTMWIRRLRLRAVRLLVDWTKRRSDIA